MHRGSLHSQSSLHLLPNLLFLLLNHLYHIGLILLIQKKKEKAERKRDSRNWEISSYSRRRDLESCKATKDYPNLAEKGREEGNQPPKAKAWLPAPMLNGELLRKDASIKSFNGGVGCHVASSLEEALLLPNDIAELWNIKRNEVFLNLKRYLGMVWYCPPLSLVVIVCLFVFILFIYLFLMLLTLLF